GARRASADTTRPTASWRTNLATERATDPERVAKAGGPSSYAHPTSPPRPYRSPRSAPMPLLQTPPIRCKKSPAPVAAATRSATHPEERPEHDAALAADEEHEITCAGRSGDALGKRARVGLDALLVARSAGRAVEVHIRRRDHIACVRGFKAPWQPQLPEAR